MKNKNNKFLKLFNFSFSIIHRDAKMYFIMLIFPIFIQLLIFSISSNLFINKVNAYTTLISFLIPSFFCMVYVATIIFEWKKTVLLRQIKNFNLSNTQFLFYMYINFLILIFEFSFALILFDVILNQFTNKIIFSDLKNNFNGSLTVFGIFIAIIFESLISIGIGFSVGVFIKNIYLVQTINILFLVVFLLFSNLIVDASTLSSHKWFCIIGYFIPQSYPSWVIILMNSKININWFYIYFVIKDLDGYISFKNIYIPILISLIICVFISAGNWALFRNYKFK